MELVNKRKDWKTERLGDFARYEKGKKPKNQSPKKDEKFHYPYINIRAFEKGIIETYTDGVKCNFCDENDFLMVWDGSRSGLVGKGMNGALGSTIMRINFPGIENNYAYYFLQSKYLEINTRAKGTGTPHVDPGLLWNYFFPIAPLLEQKAIVTKLDSLLTNLDQGIASFEKAAKQLSIYRQAVLKKAFEGELTKAWRAQQTDLPTAEELLAQIKSERQQHHEQQLKDWEVAVANWEAEGKVGRKPGKPKKLKELPPFDKNDLKDLAEPPNRWSWVRLANIVKEMCLGKMLDKNKNKGELEPYLGNINVRWGKFNLEGLQKMRFESFEKERYSLKKGDLVLCEGGEPGRCAIWKKDSNIKIQKALHRVRFFEQMIQVKYIYYFIIFSANGKHLSKHFTGTTIKHLTGTGLAKLEIPICSVDEQIQIVQEIESRLSVCDNLADTIQTNLQKAKALRQSILKKAFDGRLLTEEELAACRAAPDYEPAAVLLARIKKEKAEKEALAKEEKKKKKRTKKPV